MPDGFCFIEVPFLANFILGDFLINFKITYFNFLKDQKADVVLSKTSLY